MKSELQLKDLYLGMLDAKNELLTETEDEKSRFIDSFLIPNNFSVNDYLGGTKYFVTGLKGTGKTALLRYLAIKAEEQNFSTSFILFKSDFSEQDKKDFTSAARTVLVENQNNAEDQDYEDIWRWFLHRHIVSEITNKKLDLFENDQAWQKYLACVKAPKISDNDSGIFRLFPKLKRGSVEINAGFEALNTKLGLEFDWEDANKTKVKFNSIVKQADVLFERLSPLKNKLYIYLDELEISIGTSKQFSRDIRLIRDLIVAIERMNYICRKKKFGIMTYAAIRSEVVTAIKSAGKEINKVIFDFGTKIEWHQSGDDINKHPILQILIKRIQASEKHYNLVSNQSNEEMWKRYFPSTINGRETSRHILHQTWYRPRDVVRLLGLSRTKYPEKTMFSQQVFDGTRLDYSTEAWTELVEELRAKYTVEQIEGIKRIFTGIQGNFVFSYINNHVKNIREIYSVVDDLLKLYKLDVILSDAYRIGIIGNMDKKARFAFRGNDDILLEKKMMVHHALWPILSIESSR